MVRISFSNMQCHLPTFSCVCVVAGQVTNVVRSCLQSSLALKQASGYPRGDAIGLGEFVAGKICFPQKWSEHLGVGGE